MGKEQVTPLMVRSCESLPARGAGYDFSGVQQAKDEVGMYSVGYSAFVVPLVKAVQELAEQADGQQKIMEKLEAENAELKAEINDSNLEIESLHSRLTEMDELKSRMAKLEAALLQKTASSGED